MKYFFLLIIFFLSFGMNFAQKPDTTKQNVTLKNVAEKFDFYGSLDVHAVKAFNGYSAIQNGASRLGFEGETNITKGILMFARLEVGVNMVDNNNKKIILELISDLIIRNLMEIITVCIKLIILPVV